MPKKKNEEAVEVEEAVEAPAPKASKKTYVVLDSNGKAVRTVDDEETAKELVKAYGGRLQR